MKHRKESRRDIVVRPRWHLAEVEWIRHELGEGATSLGSVPLTGVKHR